jgi:hypothetical protein
LHEEPLDEQLVAVQKCIAKPLSCANLAAAAAAFSSNYLQEELLDEQRVALQGHIAVLLPVRVPDRHLNSTLGT